MTSTSLLRKPKTYSLTLRTIPSTLPADVSVWPIGLCVAVRPGVGTRQPRSSDCARRCRPWTRAYSAWVRAAELKQSLLTSAPAPGRERGLFFHLTPTRDPDAK